MSRKRRKVVRAPFRIAIRSEGHTVNAYFAPEESMEDAVLMASIKQSLLDASPGLYDEWRELLQRALSAVMQDVTGVKIAGWGDPEPAPEHERSGKA